MKLCFKLGAETTHNKHCTTLRFYIPVQSPQLCCLAVFEWIIIICMKLWQQNPIHRSNTFPTGLRRTISNLWCASFPRSHSENQWHKRSYMTRYVCLTMPVLFVFNEKDTTQQLLPQFFYLDPREIIESESMCLYLLLFSYTIMLHKSCSIMAKLS